MDAANVAQVFVGPVDALTGVADTLVGEGLKPDEHSIAATLPRQAHQLRIARKVDGDLGRPAQLERQEGFEQRFGPLRIPDDVVVHEIDEAPVQR